MKPRYDHTKKDAMAMEVRPVAVGDFDLARYEAFAAEADERYAAFLQKQEGVAVWQRVRVGEVFRDGCRNAEESLRWQLGALTQTLNYSTDAPTYLEPWYGIGTTAAAFGADYEWQPGLAPAVKPACATLEQAALAKPRKIENVPILQYTLATIECFLNETKGRLPVSWCDIQGPLNIAAGMVDVSQLLLGFHESPKQVREVLSAATDELIRFTQLQSKLIGPALARPGHGFASSRAGSGIGLSTDNLIMISPAMFQEFCVADCVRIGKVFGGTGIHSCGNWGRWLEAVKKIPNLAIVDGAFSPQTDPAWNKCEQFRDALAGTGIILHARIVGSGEEVLNRVRRLWKPGMKLIVVTHIQDPAEQRKTYAGIHQLCS